MPCTFSAGNAVTGSRPFYGKVTGSCSFIRGWRRRGASGGPGTPRRQGAFPGTGCAEEFFRKIIDLFIQDRHCFIIRSNGLAQGIDKLILASDCHIQLADRVLILHDSPPQGNRRKKALSENMPAGQRAPMRISLRVCLRGMRSSPFPKNRDTVPASSSGAFIIP